MRAIGKNPYPLLVSFLRLKTLAWRQGQKRERDGGEGGKHINISVFVKRTHTHTEKKTLNHRSQKDISDNSTTAYPHPAVIAMAMQR